MICRYCEQPKRLIKAHVIPETFFRRLREGKQSPLLVRQREHLRRSPIGIYDPEILCADCDAIFAPWDDYAQKVLSPELKNANAITDGIQIGGWTIADYQYDLLKLFFISLLWRASVSQHPFYHRIKLGTFEPIAQGMIAQSDPGQPEEFGVVLARFTDALGTSILDPHPDRLDGIKYCRFYLGRYIAYIKTDARPPSETWRAFTMKPDQPLCIVARNLQRSKELAVMHKVVASSRRKNSRTSI